MEGQDLPELMKMTLKVGLGGTWGAGKLTYWQKWF
jgi:hypothetical protein